MKAIISPVELFGEQVTFVAGIIKDNVMPPEYVSVMGILTDPKYHNILEMVDDYEFGYDIVGGAVIPVLKDYDEDSDNVIELEGDLDIKHLGDMVLFDEDMSDVDSLLKSLIDNYDSNKFKQLCSNACNFIYQLEQYNFKYNLNRKVPADIKAIADKYNSESKGTGIVETKLATGNLTLTMDNCESELFIEIPAPYYDPNAKDLDEYTQDFANVSEVFKALSPYGDNTDACSPNTFMRAANELGLENIIGYSDNNHLPIQQNERRFYEALKRYIHKSLELYLSKENMLTESELESRIKNNVLPAHIKLVLESFVKAFVNVNWRHSTLVPANEFKPEAEASDDDDDGDKMSESAELNSEYDLGGVDISRVNLDNLSHKLNHYLVSIENLMKSNLTAYAWAELIVKLARWGTRKPTHIIFTEEESGTNCNAMLNVNEFSLEEDLTYLTQLETVKYGDADYLPLSVIATDTKDFCDQSSFCDKLGIEYDDAISYSILGLRCRQDFITAKGTKGRNVYFDLFSIIDLYRNGKGSIYGIEYDGEKFSVDDAVESRIGNYMTLSSILSLLSKPDSFMEKVFVNEYVVKELSDSKEFTVKDILYYNLYNVFNRLIYSTDIIEEYKDADRLSDPKKWAIISLAKCVLNYAFLPKSEKSTLENALNNMNALYNGFEPIDFSQLVEEDTHDVSKTNLFGAVKKEYTAVKKLDIGGGLSYYVIPTVEDSPDGYRGILGDNNLNIINKDSVETLTGAKARFNLGRLVFEADRNATSSGIYINPELLASIKKGYIELYTTDIVQDYVVTARRLQEQQRAKR